MTQRSAWQSAIAGQTLTRRGALGVSALGLGGALAAACGGSGNNKKTSSVATAVAPAGSAAAAASTAAATAAATRAVQAPAAGGTAVSAATQSADTPVRGGTLRRGTWLSVLGIDPHIEVSVGLYMMAGVYTYLAGFNILEQKLNLIFAESYEQPSATEFVFKLRKGVKFQNIAPVNGREVTSADVIYSFQRFRDLPQAQNNDFFKTVTDKMEAVDQYTFRLTTKQPFAESINELGSIQKAIVPHEAVEKFGDLSTNGIGAGPYILDQYTKGEKTVLKRNPDYFDKNLPYLDGVTWTTILDQSTLLQAYKSGQVDIGAGPYEGNLLTKLDYEDLLKNDKLVNQKLPALHYGSLAVNVTVKPFDDVRVRKALWLGVDRQQFIDKVGLGEGTPQGILNNGLAFWVLSQDELKPYIAPDIKKAKDLLTAAGYPNGFDMTIETSGGVQLYIDHAEVLIAELKKIGINAKLNLSDLPSYLSDKLFKGNFNSTVFTHNPYTSPKIPIGFYHKNGLGNGSWWHYANEDISKAIDTELSEMDINKRQKLVKDVQKMILEDGGPMINFFSPTLFQSYHKRVGGFDPALRPFQYFRYTEFLRPGL